MVTDRETALTEARELAEILKGIEAEVKDSTLVITKGRELALSVRAVANQVSLVSGRKIWEGSSERPKFRLRAEFRS